MRIDAQCDIVYEHTVNNRMHPSQHIFDIYNSDKSNRLGTLVCHKSAVPLRPDFQEPILAIDFLEVSTKDKGFGTKILKFAEEYSKQVGCRGFMTLKADGSYTPERIPHTFYRRYGFSTLNTKTDRKLDKFVKRNLSAKNSDFPCLLMHFPPKPTTWQIFAKKCRVVLRNLFK